MLIAFLLALLAAAAFCQDCTSSRDQGETCNQSSPSRQFYYDTRMKVCQPFQYFGCGGNRNRYGTSKECRDACQTKKPAVGAASSTSSNTTDPNHPPFVPQGDRHDQWRKAEICGSNYLIPNGEYILCTNNQPCPAYHTCVSGACCPEKNYVCSLRDDNGNFQNGIEDRPRFAWNHDVHNCVRYSYYGANGNYNNFPNFQSCVKYCQSSSRIVL
ncbi:unnamed protein product [Caenorhabditis bovis]|uniref:BPTI/Kunitz inhibitor domain-containing protein n=1 Tax=Caenorhabditis bovis TaxID=2654633 RepID=A0A8S1EGE7_9PELO|nr:unnamed protein product [Caenorhabditis bovis]